MYSKTFDGILKWKGKPLEYIDHGGLKRVFRGINEGEVVKWMCWPRGIQTARETLRVDIDSLIAAHDLGLPVALPIEIDWDLHLFTQQFLLPPDKAPLVEFQRWNDTWAGKKYPIGDVKKANVGYCPEKGLLIYDCWASSIGDPENRLFSSTLPGWKIHPDGYRSLGRM